MSEPKPEEEHAKRRRAIQDHNRHRYRKALARIAQLENGERALREALRNLADAADDVIMEAITAAAYVPEGNAGMSEDEERLSAARDAARAALAASEEE